MQETNEKTINNLIENKESRTILTKEGHLWFFVTYFNHYMTHPFAKFHHEMFKLTEDDDINTALIMAFRGSAKSTIFTLSYPIWAIIGKPQKKFIIIVGETQRQSRQHLMNIRKELENNELLKQDLGPFQEVDEWGLYSLVIPKYNARITAVSMDQTIRGMRHMQYRPDLIICDDIEDLQSVKTQEGRNKLHEWVSGEIIPAGDKNTKIIFVGSILHEDSLLMRIKEKIDDKAIDGKLITIPLLNEDNEIAWPGKYKNMEEIDVLRRTALDEASWSREYLLTIISGNERVIHPNWIHHYDKIPKPTPENEFRFCATGVDLAISQNNYADHTAMVTALVYGYENNLKIYILPNIVDEKLGFPETTQQIETMAASYVCYPRYRVFIEDVGYQRSIIQQLEENCKNKGGYGDFKVEPFKPKGGKRNRLSLVSGAVYNGTILFPKDISPILINQLVDFGKEKYDDLTDAFTALNISILNRDHTRHISGIMFPFEDGKDCLFPICID